MKSNHAFTRGGETVAAPLLRPQIGPHPLGCDWVARTQPSCSSTGLLKGIVPHPLSGVLGTGGTTSQRWEKGQTMHFYIHVGAPQQQREVCLHTYGAFNYAQTCTCIHNFWVINPFKLTGSDQMVSDQEIKGQQINKTSRTISEWVTSSTGSGQTFLIRERALKSKPSIRL